MTTRFTTRAAAVGTVLGLALMMPALAFAASASISTLSASTVNVGSPVTLSVVPVDFVGLPTYAVSDSYSGTGASTVGSGNIDSNGNFSWTPQSSDVGSHTLTFTVADSSGNNVTVQQVVTVNAQPAAVSVGAISPSNSVTVGQPVSFAITTTGFTSPTYAVSDSMGGTITDMNVDSNGNFTWTPTSSDVGTHVITITAGDLYGHNASATTTITVAAQATPATTTTTTATPTPTSTSALNAAQVSAIISLLQSFGVDQGTITNVSSILSGGQPVATNTTTTSSVVGDGYVFNNYLGVGSTGTDVTELQMRLEALGDFNQDPTGYYGSVTQAAVEQFQTANGIEAVGYVGPATRAALNAQ